MTIDLRLSHLTPAQRRELETLVRADRAQTLWRPLPGPQRAAFESKATIIGYGGAAGGGKTDLAIGLALTQHQRVAIFRENGTELLGVVDRLAELLGSRDGFNGKDNIWRTLRRDGTAVQIELGSFPNPGDEEKYRGRPHDFLVFDEAQNMRESAVRFLLGWLRTTDQSQRCRAVLGFNPPSSIEGRWLLKFFAPWIDKSHPNPAKPGELRWFAVIAGKEVEVDGPDPFRHDNEFIMPQSRTFIPSRIADNPFLMATGYMSQLQSMPEPLRSQMLNGDFSAGIQDDQQQVIPTAWVELAQARWKRPDVLPPMTSMGVDVARGGRDQTIIARRHGTWWFDEPLVYAGSTTPDGPSIAGLVVAAMRDHAPIHVDVIGVGSSPYDFLVQTGLQCIPVNVAMKAPGFTTSGSVGFANLRSSLWWQMRELLDPTANNGIALPPAPALLADLTSATWKLVGGSIQVASRDDIIKRIGRSPDYASAYLLAMMHADKPARWRDDAWGEDREAAEHDPLLTFRAIREHGAREHDPRSYR